MPKAADDRKAFNGPQGLKLVLRYVVDELRQRDVERFMAAVNRSTLGVSAVEYNGKILRAAVEAGWVVEPVWKLDKTHDDVAELKPWEVAWYAKQIDDLYRAAVAIPKA